jgi:Aspartyl protease
MLEGRFGNTSGSPYLEARISFPRLRLWGMVSFLVDTGADGTVFMPADSKTIGIDFRNLTNPTTSEGIGGAAQGFNETAVLSFSDRKYIYSYLLKIEISAPTRHNHRFHLCLAAIFLSGGASSWTPLRRESRLRLALGICARKSESSVASAAIKIVVLLQHAFETLIHQSLLFIFSPLLLSN